MGPYVYDLVALLRDSYVELSEELLTTLIARYAGLAGLEKEKVMADFDLVTVQRKLKDAGRFVYIDRVKGNPNYLRFIPTSLRYVKRALDRHPELLNFKASIERFIPEWRS